MSRAMNVPKILISDCRGLLAALAAKCRFWRNESGGAAVDFALVMLPFLAVLMAIIESAIVLLAGQVLQTATTNASRQILTGQAQKSGWSAAQFQNYVCGGLTVMFNCAKLYIDVRSFPSFTSVVLPSVTNPNGTLTNNYVFSPGNPGDVVVVRLIYQWPIYASGLGISQAILANNANTLVSTAAFRNEPYTPGPS
jgi:Flp pilus assembly protein TadG